MIRNRTFTTLSSINPAFAIATGNDRGPHSGPKRSDKVKTIEIKKDKLRFSIPVQNILYVKSEHVYCRIFFLNDQCVLQRVSLEKLLVKLPQEQFLRVHRSFLVNMAYIVKFNSKKMLVGTTVIPIGRTWRSQTLTKLRPTKE